MADHIHVWERDDDNDDVKYCIVCHQRRTRAWSMFMKSMAQRKEKASRIERSDKTTEEILHDCETVTKMLEKKI